MKDAPSRAIMLFGTEETVPPRKMLRAGPLTCELDGGNLRYVRIGGREALRAIAFIVRDQNWGTYNPTLENLKVGQGPDHFEVSYDAVCKDAEQELRYRATIRGAADGTLSFEGTRAGGHRLHHQPHRLCRAAPDRGRRRRSRSRCCIPTGGACARASRS